MNDLKKLKGVLSKGSDEKNQVHNLCAAMEIVGGYEQLMNMPIPALNLVLDYLEFVNKQSKKGMKGKR